MLNELVSEWKSFTKRQKIILSIYFVCSLPLLPFNIIMIPFAHWITQSANQPIKKITLMDFLCMSMATSIYAYLIGAVVTFCIL